ncbi:MAG: hypothetical protein Ct9H300mP17_00410 [Candidatus Nitrosopelagicus sp.]|nr:MAG: hypothetical protein Ct9H300mP17_00410 [Candidatus Nitrosopelagicus sp.]
MDNGRTERVGYGSKSSRTRKTNRILRKGGILETASGFNIESKKFFLFPTWEHQETKHVKPKFSMTF